MNLTKTPPKVQIQEQLQSILGWPTDTVSIDYYEELEFRIEEKRKNNNSNDNDNNDDDCNSLNDGGNNDSSSKHEQQHNSNAAAAAFSEIRNSRYNDDKKNENNNILISAKQYPHTIILFIPGNPGCISWYVPSFLVRIVERLGPGYAARGVSYAGHGTSDEITNVQRWENNNSNGRDTDIPWTVDGQIEHKIAWVDMITKEMQQLLPFWKKDCRFDKDNKKQKLPKFIFLSHSIGSHMVQRLCMIRYHDIFLQHTALIIHLMPFIRMDAYDKKEQKNLNEISSTPQKMINKLQLMAKIFQLLPHSCVDYIVMKLSVPNEGENSARKLTIDITKQLPYAKNFFTLGSEEMRDVPQIFDIHALRLIAAASSSTSSGVPMVMLYCHTNDKWAPAEFHVSELKHSKQKLLPNSTHHNIHIETLPNMQHAFIIEPKMTNRVTTFCTNAIKKHYEGNNIHYQSQQQQQTCTVRSKL